MSSFEYPHGRIARTVEKKAGEEFGPERLKKETLAAAFNLLPEQITDEEWAEIYEFSVNAGVDLIRSAIKKDVAPAIAADQTNNLTRRIRWNEDSFIPFHDIFHAAETYRLTKGNSASAEFITPTDSRSRYTDPNLAVAELYPVLFLVLQEEKVPLPVLLTTREGREKIAEKLSYPLEDPTPEEREIQRYLRETPHPQIAEERKKEYERVVEFIVISQAMQALKRMGWPAIPLSLEEKEAIHAAMKNATENPPRHYKEFAERVFRTTDWNEEPRLFLDEFLESIRSFKKAN